MTNDGGRKLEMGLLGAGDGHAGGEEGFFVHLDKDRVVAGVLEGQVANLVDEVDALQLTGGLERALDEGLQGGGVVAHGDADVVLAGGDIAEGEEPHHERVGDRELARVDIREDAENGVLAGSGVDVDAVAGEPDENLWF